ncbi:hypothetical protein [Photobacterium atrarenae]|uniref:Secreted protein n=1 Tax=Photobacterium atrarenae TaxID=865757 RepID=A0ABY5GKG6_9GAMM|nr:hypothetical protein [Photobacterium atrarenae]UTV29732.1 hypothetical protein NNL38_22240 [Photobacterium atrarenae]
MLRKFLSMVLLVLWIGLGAIVPASAHLPTPVQPELSSATQAHARLAVADHSPFEQSASQDFCHTLADVFMWHAPCAKTTASQDSDNHQHAPAERQLDPALIGPSRIGIGSRDDADDTEPLYLLAIELPIEPVPSFVVGYRIDFHATRDWTRRVRPSAGRIGGWKDSNRLYQPYQHRFSLLD